MSAARDEPGVKQACARVELTDSTPVIELVAIRVVELARTGESDPDRLIEATVSTFEGSEAGGGRSCAASRVRSSPSERRRRLRG
jgi:hypothetical protein